MRTKPRVAVSSCLLGVPVRFDGGHRRATFLIEELGPRVEWVKVCPEVEIGLGTPRDPIDLHETDDPRRPRLLQGQLDLTERMRAHALARIGELRAAGVDAYILKARSPSCGLREAKLVRRDGEVDRAGVGIFAQTLRESWPELPAFDETDLLEPHLACARVDWIFTMFRFRCRASGAPGLLSFHEGDGVRVGSRSSELASRLEHELARALQGSDDVVADAAGRYGRYVSEALARGPAPGAG